MLTTVFLPSDVETATSLAWIVCKRIGYCVTLSIPTHLTPGYNASDLTPPLGEKRTPT